MKNSLPLGRYLLGLICFLMLALNVHAQQNKISVCWAEWDPSEALGTLSQDFTAETGIEVEIITEPWTSYTQRFKASLNSGSDECDLIVGDSQWLGGSAESGHYVKLNDFFDDRGIDMSDFVDATVEAYSVWPKGSDQYWSIPAMGDAVGWVYRRDWFERPDIKADFQKQYGWALERPKNWNELLQIAEFFQGRVIDGKKVSGAAIYTEGASEGITMGFTSAFYAWGAAYHSQDNQQDIDGYVNSKVAVEALQFYKRLYDCCSPANHGEAYMLANLDKYKKGEVAMQMNFFAFFPGVANDPDVGGEKSGFFVNPEQNVVASTLGGQGISLVSYSKNKEQAKSFLEWFARADVQKIWWQVGGYSVHKSVLNNPFFPRTKEFAPDFLSAMESVKDFWQKPQYQDLLAVMQKHVHAYVVRGEGSAQQALDNIVSGWEPLLGGNIER